MKTMSLGILFAIAAIAAEGTVYDLDVKWTSDAGKTVTLKEWSGQPVVLSMGYTSCKGTCPLILKRMREIQSENEAKGIKAKYVFVTFDPSVDTPKALAEYRKKIALDAKDWTFLSGKESNVRRLTAVLGIRYSKDKETGEIMHDNKVVLIDEFGKTTVKQAF